MSAEPVAETCGQQCLKKKEEEAGTVPSSWREEGVSSERLRCRERRIYFAPLLRRINSLSCDRDPMCVSWGGPVPEETHISCYSYR